MLHHQLLKSLFEVRFKAIGLLGLIAFGSAVGAFQDPTAVPPIIDPPSVVQMGIPAQPTPTEPVPGGPRDPWWPKSIQKFETPSLSENGPTVVDRSGTHSGGLFIPVEGFPSTINQPPVAYFEGLAKNLQFIAELSLAGQLVVVQPVEPGAQGIFEWLAELGYGVSSVVEQVVIQAKTNGVGVAIAGATATAVVYFARLHPSAGLAWALNAGRAGTTLRGVVGPGLGGLDSAEEFQLILTDTDRAVSFTETLAMAQEFIELDEQEKSAWFEALTAEERMSATEMANLIKSALLERALQNCDEAGVSCT